MADHPTTHVDPAEAVAAWIGTQRAEMLALLEELVNIDGGSRDKAGVDAVGAALRRFLEGAGVACEAVPVAEFGDALRAAVPGRAGNRPVMLLGHRDTVFPRGEPLRRPFRVEGDRAYGPGVADMKAGLVINAFTLAGYAKFGPAGSPVVGLFTSDEEIGSPASRPIIEAEARGARAVFNSEPGRPSGAVVTRRKGGVFSRCEITGKAAHSGANFADGASAIEELARKVQALHALTDLEAGTTVNVGLVSGGQSINTVAPSAVLEIDLRYVDPADRDRLAGAIRAVAETCATPGTTSRWEILGEFLPLAPTPESEALFRVYAEAAAASGLTVTAEATGGCADSGFTAGVGTPTVCGTGPVGGAAHTPEEWLDLTSLAPRAQALARAVGRAAG